MNGQNKVEMSVRLRKLQKGADGQSAFKSIVFKRSASKPSTPTGGSYSSPVPSYWSDGIPAESNGLPCWMSSRTFTSDGLSPQTAAWSEPQLMADTSDFDVCFSASESKPAAPTSHGTQNSGTWHNEAQDGDIWMATSTCSNGQWSDWNIVQIKGEDAVQYSLVPSPSAVRMDASGNLSSASVTATAYKTVGSARSAYSGGYIVTYKKLKSGGGLSGGSSSSSATVTSLALADYVKFTLKASQFSTEVLAECTVPIMSDGENATSPVTIDLDNENASVPCDYEGNPGIFAINSTAKLFDGNADKTDEVTADDGWSVATSGCTASMNDNVLTVTGISEDTATATVTAQYGGNSYSAVMTLAKVRGGENGEPATVYEIIPSVSVVAVAEDDTRSVDQITVEVYRVTGGERTKLTNSAVHLRYNATTTGSSTESGRLTADALTLGSAQYKAITFTLFESALLNSKVLDKETVPFIYDGKKGQDGIGSYAIDLDNENINIGLTSTANGLVPASGYNSGTSKIFVAGGGSAASLTDVYAYLNGTEIAHATTSAASSTYTDNGNGINSLTLSKIESNESNFDIQVSTTKVRSQGEKMVFSVKGVMTVTDGAGTRQVEGYKAQTVMFQPPGADGKTPTIYDIIPSNRTVIVAEDGTRRPESVSWTVIKRSGNSVTNLNTFQQIDNEGLIVYAYVNGSDDYTEMSGNSIDVTDVAALKLELRGSGMEVQDTEEISFAHDGASAVIPFVKPDNITYSQGVALSVPLSVGVRIGEDEITSGVTIGSTLRAVSGNAYGNITGSVNQGGALFTSSTKMLTLTSEATYEGVVNAIVSYDGKSYYVPITISRAAKGQQGSAGPAGVTYRRSEWQSGVTYLNETDKLGQQDICYVDIVTRTNEKGQLVGVWQCKKSHGEGCADTGSYDPSNETYVNAESDHWIQFSNFGNQPVYTPLLMAKDAVIGFIQGNSLKIYDGDALKAGVQAATGSYPVFYASPTDGEKTETARWQQFADGSAQYGEPTGARVYLNASPSTGLPHIGIYDGNGAIAAMFDGSSVTDAAEVYGSGDGTKTNEHFTVSSSASSKAKADIDADSAESVYVSGFKSKTFALDSAMSITIPSFTLHLDYAVSTGSVSNGWLAADFRAQLLLDGTPVSGAIATFSDGVSLGENGETTQAALSISGNKEVAVPQFTTLLSAGSHTLKLQVYCTNSATTQNASDETVGLHRSGSVSAYFANPSTLNCSFAADRQLCRYFANGFAVGSATNNYCMAWNNGGKMNFIIENPNYGFKVDNSGIYIKRPGTGWTSL